MRISWNWLSELVDLQDVKSPQDLAKLLTSLGLEVETIHDLSAGLENVISAQVLEKKQHPDADRLSLCKVSKGKGEPLDIVCGAQNFKQGDKVLLAQIGAQLPNGMGIKEGKIRGALSQGMLCSEQELGLADSSEGILVLPPDTPVGKAASDILGRHDVVFELGITPNRGDCLSHLGIAREVAAATGAKLKYKPAPALDLKKKPAVLTEVSEDEKTPQFWGASLEGVKVGPSPQWVVQKLEAMGSRSINNVVDATNLVLYELGQPTHVYDASLLEGKKLSARFSKKGEILPLLDDTSVTLTGEELVIADEKKAVALAGVMGGGNSEVRDTSTSLYLECAEFDPVLTRRTAHRFVKHTDSSQRFERGIDPTGQPQALARLVQLILELAGGKFSGVTAAVNAGRTLDPEKFKLRKIDLDPNYVGHFLGVEVKEAEVKRILKALGCEIETSEKRWKVSAPPYRWDLAIKEDLAEEVCRFIGYDKIPATVPPLTSAPEASESNEATSNFKMIESAKDALRELGLNESIQFSFSSRNLLSSFGMDSSLAIRNPLSEDQEVLVPSLIPGMVQSAAASMDRYFGSDGLSVRTFQIRPTFHFSGTVTEQGISARDPRNTGIDEKWKLSLLMSGTRYAQALKTDQSLIDFYDLKAVMESFFEKMGTKGIRFQGLYEESKWMAPNEGLLHPGKSVRVYAGRDAIGCFGLMSPKIVKNLKLKLRSDLWLAELDWDALRRMSRSPLQAPSFAPWSEHPTIERDFALLVKDGTESEKICQIASKVGKPLAKDVRIFDTYKGNPVPAGMTSVAVRIIFSGDGRSLQEEEADKSASEILSQWKSQLGVELRK